MNQVHGTAVRTVDRRPTDTAATDGIVTTATGLGLAVLVADCVPLLAGDPRGRRDRRGARRTLGAAAGIDVVLLDTMVARRRSRRRGGSTCGTGDLRPLL